MFNNPVMPISKYKVFANPVILMFERLFINFTVSIIGTMCAWDSTAYLTVECTIHGFSH